MAQSKSNIDLKEKATLSCKLTSADLQERRLTVIAELKKNLISKNETDQGYIYTFKDSNEMINQLTEFIKTERLCCNFFTFRLEIGEEPGIVALRLSGSDGIKEFIDYELGM